MAPEPPSSDVKSIAAGLRASIRKAGVPRSHTLAAAAGTPPEAQIDFDIETLKSSYNIASAPFTSHRRLLGSFIISLKTFARELLIQLFARQSAYNGAAARSITHLNHRLNLLTQEHARMAQRLAEIESRIGIGPPWTSERQSTAAEAADGFDPDRVEAREEGVANRNARLASTRKPPCAS